MIVLFNKPFNVLCQFTDKEGRKTLSDFISIKNIYPAGRLDFDSEGLVVLTDEGKLQHLISDPENKMIKTYLVQVEGIPKEEDLNYLRREIRFKDTITKPAKAEISDEPVIWRREKPIRERKNIPTSWIKISIAEGKNRQVRRMTAAIGFPALRLIRISIGSWSIGKLKPGEWKIVSSA